MKTRYYSPQLERSLITRLYHAAKAEGMPMTRFTNRLVEESLARRGRRRLKRTEAAAQRS